MPAAPLSFEDPTVVSEIAHIVARKPDGPRGDYDLPIEARDRYTNLILLCERHHKIVDSNPDAYPVAKLRQMKADHEADIAKATGQAVSVRRTDRLIQESDYITENLHSTVLPVITMPRYIYKVTCELSDRDHKEVTERLEPTSPDEMCPFILRSGWIYCFQNLEEPGNAFEPLTDGEIVDREEVSEWMEDPDRERMLQDLLNRALNKLTGRKGLNFDRKHKRYYFMPEVLGKPLEVAYRPMNQQQTSRSVVWQPTTKKTGQPKTYWLHRAVQLRFYRISQSAWVLSLRPGFHVSSDGITPYQKESVGRQVNKKMSRLFNYELLTEIHFWRDYLSGSRSHIVLPFGAQSLQLESRLLSAEVLWPGMPEEHAKRFANADYQTDMFMQLELNERETDEEELEDWEFD